MHGYKNFFSASFHDHMDIKNPFSPLLLLAVAKNSSITSFLGHLVYKKHFQDFLPQPPYWVLPIGECPALHPITASPPTHSPLKTITLHLATAMFAKMLEDPQHYS
jgi:hypothetical protein